MCCIHREITEKRPQPVIHKCITGSSGNQGFPVVASIAGSTPTSATSTARRFGQSLLRTDTSIAIGADGAFARLAIEIYLSEAFHLATPLGGNAMAGDDFDSIDLFEFEDDEDQLMGWEQEARGAAEEIVSDIKFDDRRGVLVIDGEDFVIDDFNEVVGRIAEAYDEQWYANVPFDGGEAVFDSDAQSYAEERLTRAGFFSFFDRISERRAGRLVLVVAERRDSGILVPRDSAIEFQELGLFTSDELAEFEALISSPLAREADIQGFLERYPQFMRKWGHPAVHPHVSLAREDRGPLIPDFLLCNAQDHKAAIVDLKLPSARLVRRQQNRDRWRDAINEARAQLLRYRDWFEVPDNRRSLVDAVGMEIYRPSLAVLVGRGTEFRDAFERQQLAADLPEIEVVTYDELVNWAAQRTVN